MWESAHKQRLSKRWVAGLSDVQREAIYSVLYALAEEVFELIARRKQGETCQEAVETVVGDPSLSLTGHVQVWQPDCLNSTAALDARGSARPRSGATGPGNVIAPGDLSPMPAL